MHDHTLKFHTPPANQGQIVEVSYAPTMEGEVIRRTLDRSDNSVCYAIADMDDEDAGEYWQTEPDGDFTPLTERQREYFGL